MPRIALFLLLAFGQAASAASNLCLPVERASAQVVLVDSEAEARNYRARVVETLSATYGDLRLIGEGGENLVFRVKRGNQDLVVKAPRLPKDPRAAIRFSHELEVARLMENSPHLGRPTAVGTVGGIPVLEMELLPGTNLAEMMATARNFTPLETLSIIQEMGRAIAVFHLKKQSHGDLKPANFNLVGEPGTREMKGVLFDFSFSAPFGQHPPGMIDATGSPGIGGTPDYMSPEKAKGDPAAARDDLYALGRTYAELLWKSPVLDSAKTEIKSGAPGDRKTEIRRPGEAGTELLDYLPEMGKLDREHEALVALAAFPWQSIEQFNSAHEKARQWITQEGGDFLASYYGPVLLKELSSRDGAKAKRLLERLPDLKRRFEEKRLGLDGETERTLR